MRAQVMGLLLSVVAAVGGCATPDGVHLQPHGETQEGQAPLASSTGTVAAWGDVTIMRAGLGGDVAPAQVLEPYVLDTGDKLRVFVYGQPNLSRGYTVDASGRIDVPLIGEVRARGLTTSALAAHIRARLGTQFVKDPQVTVDVQQNRPFFILGEVKNAGQYPYVSGISVEAAVAIAGGYSDRADERHARVTRRSGESVDTLDVPANALVQPGDTVYVTERWF